MIEPIFDNDFILFLKELTRNNNREWFAENKSRYEQQVLGPAVELVRRLEKPLARAAPMLNAVAKGHGGSVMRIYRDTRFSKDKTPYKTNVGISIRHQAKEDIHAPGVYIHFEPDQSFVGVGSWRPEKNVLASIRSAIDREPALWKRARDNRRFRQTFELSGERLKTTPRDYDKTHPMIDDLRRLDFIATSPLSEHQVTSSDITKTIIDRIKTARPLMQFLCDAIGIPY